MPYAVRQLKCHQCGVNFTRRASAKVLARQFCSKLCAARFAGKLAGRASHAKAVAKRQTSALAQPQSYRLIGCHYRGTTKLTKVSVEDYAFLSARTWRLLKGRLYPVTSPNNRRMNRIVLSRTLGRPLTATEIAEHRNRNPLDNRRTNLRLATGAQNSANVASRRRGQYKGVQMIPGKRRPGWRATIGYEGVVILIGTFSSAVEAAYVRDQFALQLAGEFAYLNVL